MKIYDCFMFYNEFDLLDIRLEELGPYVDYFVVIEQNLTHRGKEKELNFAKRASDSEIVSKYRHKIITYTSNVTDPEKVLSDKLHIERQHRNAVQDFAKQLDESILLVSDLDEIPIGETLIGLEKKVHPHQYAMYFMYYGLKYLKSFLAHTTVVCTQKDLDRFTSAENLKTMYRGRLPTIEKSGWHLSYFDSDPSVISDKIKSIHHSEYDLPEYTSLEKIAERVDQGVDLFNRGGIDHLKKIEKEMNIPLPKLVSKNLEKYRNLLPEFYFDETNIA